MPPSETSPFIDRDRELALLEDAFRSQRAELVVLYGRRRVGKTELLRTFATGKRAVFFVADLGTEAANLADFTRQVARAIFGRTDAIGAFPTWEAALDFIADQAAEQRLLVIFDEFSYLGEVNPALPSIFQKAWDGRLRQGRAMFVLCGSYVGLMERQILGYRAPLYGRRTAQWHLRPLGFTDARRFVPHYPPEDQLRVFAILGGVPAYLLQFSDRLSLLDNVERAILSSGAYLFEEPRLLLLQELGEPARYFSILEAIANKRTRQNEIAQAVGLPSPSLPFYLGTLRELGLVDRVVPVTEMHAERSKRGSYRLLDHFFRFWFRFVYPNRSLLGRGEVGQVRTQVERDLDAFASSAFEDVCRDGVWRLRAASQLDFVPSAVGSWWSTTGTDEIDVVAIGEGRAFLGECKWSTRPLGTDVLQDFYRKATGFRRDPNVRRAGIDHLDYALFARSGFTESLRERAAADGVLLVDLPALTA